MRRPVRGLQEERERDELVEVVPILVPMARYRCRRRRRPSWMKRTEKRSEMKKSVERTFERVGRVTARPEIRSRHHAAQPRIDTSTCSTCDFTTAASLQAHSLSQRLLCSWLASS